MRVVGITEGGSLDLAHSLGGALYTMNFDQAVIRWQLLAAVSPHTGRTYLTTCVALNNRGLLGATSGIGARGVSVLDEASLAPFEVTGLLDNPAALRAALLPLLLGVTAQAEARSALASVSQLPMLATPTALHFAGVSPFRSGWAAGSSVGRDKDYEAWVQRQCADLEKQGKDPEPFLRAVNLAVGSGMMHLYQVYQQMEKVSDRARKAGIELDRVQPERTIGWEAKRLFGGDEEAAAASRGAKELFAERMEEAGLKPTSGVGKSDPHWNWVIAMDAKCPGFAAVVDKVKAKYPSVKPVSVHKWTGTIITANKKELGISQKRLI